MSRKKGDDFMDQHEESVEACYELDKVVSQAVDKLTREVDKNADVAAEPMELTDQVMLMAKLSLAALRYESNQWRRKQLWELVEHARGCELAFHFARQEDTIEDVCWRMRSALSGDDQSLKELEYKALSVSVVLMQHAQTILCRLVSGLFGDKAVSRQAK